MNNQDNILSIKLTKKNGKLVYPNEAMKAVHKEFVDSLQEEQTVEIFFSAEGAEGTNMQLAKIYPCIRKLASEVGHTFEAMKLEIKRRSGLVIGDLTNDGYAKSFADCSSEELSGVIQTIIESGDFCGINFRGKLPEVSQH